VHEYPLKPPYYLSCISSILFWFSILHILHMVGVNAG
jgi:hypothetical protein